MNNKKMGMLVLYTGSSGVGKGTIMQELLKRDKNIRLSVSNTTRPPREGEIDGVHYNFVTKEQFESLIQKDGYLEYAEYCGNYYGTPKQQVEDMLSQGYDVFLEIEVCGGLQIMEKYPDVLSIFVLPPSMDTLEKRLRDRNTEDDGVIKQRLFKAKEELGFQSSYDYIVENNYVEQCARSIIKIFDGEK